MADAIETFFATLAERGGAALSPELRGTLRFDLRREGGMDQWYVTLGNGEVRATKAMSPCEERADCIVLMQRGAFERLATGRDNLIALTLSNQVAVEGQLPLVLMFRRFFPDAPGARDPRSLAANRGAE